MRIDKITPNTPDKYIVGDFLKYYRVDNEHIVIINNSFGEVFPKNTDYEVINNHIFENWDTICCYNVEDRGEYWEFIEEEEEDTEDDYEEELKFAKLNEIIRIEELIAKAIDEKQPQFFDDTELCEIDIEYLEEDNHNLFEAAVVYKFENKSVKYFPFKDVCNNNNISTIMMGEEDDILHPIAVQIYNYYYGVEDKVEEKKVDRYEEVRRIEGIIAEAIDNKKPQPFGDYEIDIEYLEEEKHNLFEAAVVLKYLNNPERYFPLKDIYYSVSTVLKGEEDDILYSIADQIYTYCYGEEDNIEEE